MHIHVYYVYQVLRASLFHGIEFESLLRNVFTEVAKIEEIKVQFIGQHSQVEQCWNFCFTQMPKRRTLGPQVT